MLGTGIYNVKFYHLAIIALLSLTAIAFANIPINIYLSIGILILILTPNIFNTIKSLPARDWEILRATLSEYRQKNGTAILVLANFTDRLWIDQFIKNKISIITYDDYTKNEKEINQKLIGENYLFYAHPDSIIDNWIKNNITAENYPAVFVLQNTVENINITAGLQRAGYKKKNAWNIDPGVSQTTLYLYAKY